KKIKPILAGLFFAGAVATLYKTAVIGIAIYCAVKLTMVVLRVDVNLARIIWGGATTVIFFIMLFVFNDYYVYDQMKNTRFHDAAYSSIYVRVLQHDNIFTDVEKDSLLTGVGIGVNGTEGPSGLKVASKALDSTYINLLSNYGLIGVLLYLSTYILIMLRVVIKPGVGATLTLSLLFYHL
ncbi:TPA: hypothetical protein ACQVHP_004964, partial [Serratia marcescens]